MPWEILPHEGLGPVRLGVTSGALSGTLGEVPVPFARVVDDPSTSCDERYPGHDVFAYYDREGRLAMVESCSEAPDSTPTLGDILLVGRLRGDVLRDLADRGYEPDQDDGVSQVFAAIGVTIFGSSDDVEAVGVFRRGYFERDAPVSA